MKNQQKTEKTAKVAKITDKKRNVYANVIIAICVAVSLVVTASVIYEYHRLGAVIPSGVLTALLGFWGGELLIVALRQIFGSDCVTKARQAKYGSTNAGYSYNDLYNGTPSYGINDDYPI